MPVAQAKPTEPVKHAYRIKREKGELQVSEAVWAQFRKSVHEGEDTPNRLRATLATYFFCLSPSLFQNKVIKITLEKKGFQITHVLFELNGTTRELAVSDRWEDQMLSQFINYRVTERYDEVRFSNKLKVLYKQVHWDSLQVFKALGMPLPEPLEHMAIKALEDLRIADLVVNKGFDYGYLKLRGLGLRHRWFFANNMFKNEIMQYLHRQMLDKAILVGKV